MALLGNFGVLELVLIAVVAVLVFGKDLPQAASKAYMQVRKLRNAVDDLRRDSGIERELRDIERTVREAEWEARRKAAAPVPSVVPRSTLPAPVADALPAAPAPAAAPSTPPAPAEPRAPDGSRGEPPAAPTDAASC